MNRSVQIALIGIIPACLSAVLAYMQGYKSTDTYKAETELIDRTITLKPGNNPSFRQLTYPNYGLSLLVPLSWSIEDGPARLAGGEFNLIHRYEDTRAAIGMNFRLRPVQPNYINDIPAQINNYLVFLRRNYGEVEVADTVLSGAVGKKFIYEVPTGRRKMRTQIYWLRLVPDVQLQIHCAQYTDAADADVFWREVDQVISSIVIAFDSWHSRYNQNTST